jgi:lysophospholipase L1-like esterase
MSQLLGTEILNRGVPGDTTELALARLEKDVLNDEPRIVIVCLGGNDSLQGVAIDTTFGNLTRIIEAIQRQGAMVVLVGVRSASISDQYDKRFRHLARQKGCVFVPNILRGILSDPSLRSDQVHPNDAGYRIIAERIGEAVQPFVK